MAAVAGLFPEGRRAALTPHLLSLVRKGLVRPDTSASAERDRFSFHHVLVRDCAYEALPKELRAELHERLADVMEQDAGGLELEEILGYHLEQAYAFRAGIGLDGDRSALLAERAAAHLLTAGRRALARGNAPAAAFLLQRARPLHEVSGQKPTAILIELGAALRECARLSESDAALAEAIEASRTAGDRSLEARAEIEQCFTRLYSDVPPLAEFAQLADRVAAVAPDDDLVMAKARTLAGLVQLTGCRMGAAEISLEQAWMHAQRVGERPSAQLALAVFARTALFGPRPVGEALARTSELAGRAHGDPLLVAPLKTTQAALEAMRGRFPEARALYAEAHVLSPSSAGSSRLRERGWIGLVERLAETSKRPSASSAPASRRQPRSVRKGTSRRSPDCSQRPSSSRESWTRPNTISSLATRRLRRRRLLRDRASTREGDVAATAGAARGRSRGRA